MMAMKDSRRDHATSDTRNGWALEHCAEELNMPVSDVWCCLVLIIVLHSVVSDCTDCSRALKGVDIKGYNFLGPLLGRLW